MPTKIRKKLKKPVGRPKVPKKVSVENYFAEFTETERIQIDYMITHQDTYNDIVDCIKNQFKKKQNSSSEYLVARLIDYKKYVLQPKLLTQVEDVDVYKELLSLKSKVDTMKEFTSLIYTQKKRLERALKLELIGGGVERFARQEIKLMADILEKLAKLQMDTGIIARAPRVLSGEFETDELDQNTTTFKITESFLKALDDIEAEFSEVKDIKYVEHEK